MQRLDVVHPGERHLVVGPFAPHHQGDLVLAGALERPVVGRRHPLDDLEGIATRLFAEIDEGHVVSTLPPEWECARDAHTPRFFLRGLPGGACLTGPGRIT
jgi:hypothetical protein